MEVIYEILAVIFIRVILGSIGACIRYVYLSVIGEKRSFSSLITDKDKFATHTENKESYKSAFVGFLFLLQLLSY